MARRTALLVTIGNEIVAGDIENTNGSWLARRLAALGVEVRMHAALRDEIDEIRGFLHARSGVDYVFVTGGLGGTPDDITREAIAETFGVPCVEIPDLAASLRERFAHKGLSEYAARWAVIPAGAEPIDNPLGGAPGFRLDNVYVMPGLPSEMEAMFDALAPSLQGDPIASWRRSYRTGEGQIVHLLEEATRRFPAVSVGSYPRFLPDGPEVELVLKCADRSLLDEAVEWVAAAVDVPPGVDDRG